MFICELSQWSLVMLLSKIWKFLVALRQLYYAYTGLLESGFDLFIYLKKAKYFCLQFPKCEDMLLVFITHDNV